jgi:hypothetical protein
VDDQRRHDQGITVRRAVLGDAHVDQATAATTDFTADSRTSSPATPGATSGAARAWIGVRAPALSRCVRWAGNDRIA